MTAMRPSRMCPYCAQDAGPDTCCQTCGQPLAQRVPSPLLRDVLCSIVATVAILLFIVGGVMSACSIVLPMVVLLEGYTGAIVPGAVSLSIGLLLILLARWLLYATPQPLRGEVAVDFGMATGRRR